MQDEAREAVAALRDAVTRLLELQLTPLASTEVTELMADVEAERRRMEPLDHQLIAEVTERRLAGDYGRYSPADLMTDLLRIAPREAKARVKAAGDLGPRREFSGAPLEPILPLVADAQRDGTISAAHANVIRDCIHHLPSHLAYELAPSVEDFLVEHAHHLDPSQLTTVVRHLMARIDPDGTKPNEDEIARHRSYGLHERADGSFDVRGRVTAAWAAIWRPIIDALSAPVPAEDGNLDDRTPGQRRHDGMLAAGERLLCSGDLPDCGGAPVTVVVHVTEEQLETETGVGTTDQGATLPICELMHLIGDAEIVPIAFDQAGAVLRLGRTQRLASRAQRRALAARDGGCCFPGCDRPPSWTQAHHVVPWALGGRTDVDQMCLLCHFHHREFERRGWEVRMTDGVPEWLPPAWLDPLRRPRRNTAQHLAEFDFVTSASA